MNKLECSIGVYCIENKINNKKYIGSSKNLTRRKYAHKTTLKNNKSSNINLQNDWNVYGEECFLFYILECMEVYDKNELLKLEQKWIDLYAKEPNLLYNISMYANGSGGYDVSDCTKKKLSEALKGTRHGEKNSFYGKKHSAESKDKISRSKIGKPLHENTQKALEKGRGNKYHTEETYRKLSLANRGEGSATSKLKEYDVIEILKLLRKKEKYIKISEIYNISMTQISRIKNRKRWGYLYEKYPELYE